MLMIQNLIILHMKVRAAKKWTENVYSKCPQFFSHNIENSVNSLYVGISSAA